MLLSCSLGTHRGVGHLARDGEVLYRAIAKPDTKNVRLWHLADIDADVEHVRS